MNIPDEAIAVAAEAATGYCGAGWPAQAYEGEVAAALEAAAPLLMAQAWAEGANAAVENLNTHIKAGHAPKLVNPYSGEPYRSEA